MLPGCEKKSRPHDEGGSNMTSLDQRIQPEPQALACAVIPIAVLSRGTHRGAGQSPLLRSVART